MKCLGCYIEVKESYCLQCRKMLFDKAKILSVLDFDAPKADNLDMFQMHSKRLSISGVQLKYSLRLEKNRLTLSEQQGQYILKPVPPSRQLINLDDVPENEHLTMQMAKQLFKISTAANALILFKDEKPAYITRRFDVKEDGSKFMQEDFAQLSNRTKQSHGETYKYDGTYLEIGFFIQKFVAAAVPALEKFFQLIVFNYIVSNGDAHLKNYSLMRNENGEYQLTPAYDLMSTVIHSPQESDTALNLYDGDLNSSFYAQYGYYGRENFREFAKKLGIIDKRAERIIDSFLLKKKEMSDFIEQSFLSEIARQLYKSNLADKLKRIEV